MTTSHAYGSGSRASRARRTNSGRFSASSLAGTRTLTSGRVELVAVLGDGAPRDLHAALLEHLDDLLVGQRVLRVLVIHHLLNLRLDRAGARVLSGRGREAAREEELERQQPAWRLDVLLVGHAAHRALVHADD